MAHGLFYIGFALRQQRTYMLHGAAACAMMMNIEETPQKGWFIMFDTGNDQIVLNQFDTGMMFIILNQFHTGHDQIGGSTASLTHVYHCLSTNHIAETRLCHQPGRIRSDILLTAEIGPAEVALFELASRYCYCIGNGEHQ